MKTIRWFALAVFALPGIAAFGADTNRSALREFDVLRSFPPGRLAALIPMSVQDETKARRILGLWRGASEAHTRSGL